MNVPSSSFCCRSTSPTILLVLLLLPGNPCTSYRIFCSLCAALICVVCLQDCFDIDGSASASSDDLAGLSESVSPLSGTSSDSSSVPGQGAKRAPCKVAHPETHGVDHYVIPGLGEFRHSFGRRSLGVHCSLHKGCKFSKSLKRNGLHGRPMGLGCAFLHMGPKCTSKGKHMKAMKKLKRKQYQDRRRKARTRFQRKYQLEELFKAEASPFDDESMEPSEVP